MAERIQRQRAKGWRMSGAVYVGRGSKWGNPWRVVVSGRFKDTGLPCWSGRHDWGLGYPMMRTREEAVDRAVTEFRKALMEGRLLKFKLADVAELRGKDLCCWCAAGDKCHADVLLEMANTVSAAPVMERVDG